MIRETAAGIVVDVRVIPRAKRTAADGVREGALLVRVAAPPVDNAANAALVQFLSDALGVPRRAITIAAGATSRVKRVAIAGVTAAALEPLVSARPPERRNRSPR